MSFDATAYKATTRQQWEEAAEAWHRWGPTLEVWLGEATEAMLDAAGVGPRSRVLDVAGGAGGQALPAARRRARTGRPGHRPVPGDPDVRRARRSRGRAAPLPPPRSTAKTSDAGRAPSTR